MTVQFRGQVPNFGVNNITNPVQNIAAVNAHNAAAANASMFSMAPGAVSGASSTPSGCGGSLNCIA